MPGASEISSGSMTGDAKMRAFTMAMIVAGITVAGIAGGQAGTMGTPPQALQQAPASLYQTVADTEMTVTASSANLRQQPSTKAKILMKLTHGTKVQAVGTSGTWVHVKYKNLDGYVSAHLLR
jgi:hypothetical protein